LGLWSAFPLADTGSALYPTKKKEKEIFKNEANMKILVGSNWINSAHRESTYPGGGT
jgi:hypothetical protein